MCSSTTPGSVARPAPSRRSTKPSPAPYGRRTSGPRSASLAPVLPHMRSQGSGVIVNLSTFGARFPGGPGLATYAMSKAATSRFTESLQTELAGTGVRIVAIEPGFFATEIYTADKRPMIDYASVYASMVRQTDERIAAGIAGGADPAVVAAAIIAAVDDPASPNRVLVGDDAIPPGRLPRRVAAGLAGRAQYRLTSRAGWEQARDRRRSPGERSAFAESSSRLASRPEPGRDCVRTQGTARRGRVQNPAYRPFRRSRPARSTQGDHSISERCHRQQVACFAEVIGEGGGDRIERDVGV